MSILFNNALDIWSQGIVLTTKKNLVSTASVFVFLIQDCCRDIFKASLKDFSTFLSLCPLPVK